MQSHPKVEREFTAEELKNGSIRYGIIGIQDLMRDLKYWETLLVSSMMQRPIWKIVDTDGIVNPSKIWDNYQQRNLKSAMAFAALTTPSHVDEKILY